MQLLRKLLLIVIVIVVLTTTTGGNNANGQSRQSFVNIVNPVRGDEFWNSPFSPLETVKGEYEVIGQRNLEATWLIRFDAFSNPEFASFFKSLPKSQELKFTDYIEKSPYWILIEMARW